MKIYEDDETNKKRIEDASLAYFSGKLVKDMDRDELIYSIACLLETVEKNFKTMEEQTKNIKNLLSNTHNNK